MTENNTYTLAKRSAGDYGEPFEPIEGIPLMSLQQATRAKDTARVKGYDVVVFNVAAQYLS
jgi:hypothetical protein